MKTINSTRQHRIGWLMLCMAMACAPIRVSAQPPVIYNITPSTVCPGLPNSVNVTVSANSTLIKWKLNGVTIHSQPILSNIHYDSSAIVAGGKGPGSAPDQLHYPTGISFDGIGNLFISDFFNHRIQKWVQGGSSGTTVAGGNGPGSAANQLYGPNDVFHDGIGNVYIADANNHRIQKWAPPSLGGITVAGGHGWGSGANQLKFPSAVCVDGYGNIYIADPYNHRVQKWAPGATSGITVAGGHGQGGGVDQLNQPEDVCVDGSGNIYVADRNNHRIQKWAPGATHGITVAGGGGPGGGSTQLYYPVGVFIDNAGDLYITEDSRVRKWTPGATSGTTLIYDLGNPKRLVVDGNRNIYVAERLFHRVSKWVPVKYTSYVPLSYGNLVAVVFNANGDSTTSSIVTVNQTINFGSSAVACNSYTWPINGVTYTQSGTYSVTFTGAAGCDSIQTLNLTISTTPPAIYSLSPSNACTDEPVTIRVSPDATQVQWKLNSQLVRTSYFPPWEGRTVAGGNGMGAGANQFNSPSGICMDASGNLYVADFLNDRIQRWSPGAGSGVTVAGGNGPGSGADQLQHPTGVFVDAYGNIYVADYSNHRIQKWAPGAASGITVAGGNGPGSAANQLHYPTWVWVDANGDLYISDNYNDRIQKWTPWSSSGITVAGGNGRGTAANQIGDPYGICRDAAGNLFIMDRWNNRVQKWAQGATSGVTVAGGNGLGSASNQFSWPVGLWVDGNSVIYVADYGNHRIQRWAQGDTSGTTVAGGNGEGMAANQLAWPFGLVVDQAGNLYTSDGGHRVQKWVQSQSDTYIPVTAGSLMATVSNAAGCAVNSSIVTVNTSTNFGVSQIACNSYTWPVNGMTYTQSGFYAVTLTNQYGCDSIESLNLTIATAPPVIYSIAPSTVCTGEEVTVTVSTDASQVQWELNDQVVATHFLPLHEGTTVAGGNGNGAGANQFSSPTGIFVDPYGNWYIADQGNHRIQKWTPWLPYGMTVAGGNGPGSAANQFQNPTGIYVDASGNMYVADYNNHRVQMWSPGAINGITVAGGNGPGSAANQLYLPHSVFVDHAGNVFVADWGNHRIQKWAPVAASGTTVAGGNGQGNGANQFDGPTAVYIDDDDNIFVSDGFNHRIQKWTPYSSGGITVAGGNGQGAAANQLSYPSGVFVDTNGNVFVGDFYNHRIQKWLPWIAAGITVAGGNGQGGAANQLAYPWGVFVDTHSDIYIADMANHRLQKWTQTKSDTYTPDSSGNLKAIVSNTSGCGTSSANVTVHASTLMGVSQIACNSYTWPVNGVTYTESGLYSASFTNMAGCDSVLELYLTLHHTPPVIYSVTPSSVCKGEAVTITVSPDASEVQWKLNGQVVNTSYLPLVEGTTVAGGNGQGWAPNQFNNPVGLDLDSNGNLFVADAMNHGVNKWTPWAATGTVVAGSGNPFQWGNEPDRLAFPLSVFLDSIGDMYIADAGNYRIQRWPQGATSAITVAGGNGGGSASNQLKGVYDVFVDAGGNVYVADRQNQRIQKWAPWAASGITVAGGNGAGPGPNQFSYPMGVFVDKQDNLYIADFENHRVQKWASGASSGVTVAGGNGPGADANQLNGPLDVIVDTNGNVYVTDRNNHRIQKWAPGANSGITVAGGNGSGSAANQFRDPWSIYVDGNEAVYIADQGNSRIQRWPLQRTVTYTPTTGGNLTILVSNAGGCSADSVSLTVDSHLTVVSNITANNGYYWPVNQTTYTVSGTYTVTRLNMAGCDTVYILNLVIQSLPSQLGLRCLIEGYMEAPSLMKPVLFNQGQGNNNTTDCDSILVELHRKTPPYALLASAKVLMNREGFSNSLLPPLFDTCYIAIRHRNALETWSAQPVFIGADPVFYNFTDNANKAYGSNQQQVDSNSWALFSGDIAIDQNIDLLDISVLEMDITNFAYGYISSDLNGDGNADLLDIPVLESNVNDFVFGIYP